MAFTVNIPSVDRPDPPVKAIAADRRLYLARDEATVVESGDHRAAFLLAAAGAPIPGPEVIRLGLSVVDGRVVQGVGAKQAAPEADKMETPKENAESSPEDDKQTKPDADKNDKTKREKK